MNQGGRQGKKWISLEFGSTVVSFKVLVDCKSVCLLKHNVMNVQGSAGIALHILDSGSGWR
jgi:hypothetical protein